LGLPLPNGLVPQAPVHTDSLSEYQSNLEIITTTSGEGTEIRKQSLTIRHVVEQRVTHFVMALALIGTMTGPLLTVLGTMPRAIFSGVFFVVGWGSIEGNGMLHKLLYLLQENRFLARGDPLFAIRRKKIAFYLALQAMGVAVTVAISMTIAAIGFPLLICLLIPFRWKLIPRWFTIEELDTLDALTADNMVVLASLSGRPKVLGGMDEKEGRSRDAEGVQRQRLGEIHR
jgi:hypothetical protein